jgi:hypothetical protein
MRSTRGKVSSKAINFLSYMLILTSNLWGSLVWVAEQNIPRYAMSASSYPGAFGRATLYSCAYP